MSKRLPKSYISVRGSHHATPLTQDYISCNNRPRSVENEALQYIYRSQQYHVTLQPSHLRVWAAERAAIAYRRTTPTLNGAAFWLYIARRAGMSVADAHLWSDDLNIVLSRVPPRQYEQFYQWMLKQAERDALVHIRSVKKG